MGPLEIFMVGYFEKLLESLCRDLSPESMESLFLRNVISPHDFIHLKMSRIVDILKQEGLDIGALNAHLIHSQLSNIPLPEKDLDILMGEAIQLFLGSEIGYFLKSRTSSVAYA